MEKFTTDILIIGGGSAGVSAAVAASQAGAKVVLIEKNNYLGGKATASEVGTVCGLYHFSKNEKTEYAVKGFAKLFAEKLKHESNTEPLHNTIGLHYLPYDVAAFKKISIDFLNENNVKTLFDTRLKNVKIESNNITEVETNNKKIIYAKQIIDCSGESSVSLNAKLPLIKNDYFQAAAQVFTMSNISITDEAKLGMILIKELKQAIDSNLLDSTFDRVTVVPGSLKNNCVSFKIGIPHVVDFSEEKINELTEQSHQLVHKLSSYLISNSSIFKTAKLVSVAPEVGIRVGYRAKGKYILTKEDVLTCRKFETGIANGAWPIEIWGQDKRVQMQYFAENDVYQIPADCLKSASIENLYFAGRIISATDDAIASARVMGTCLQTGYAAGKLASAKIVNISEQEIISQIQQNQL